MISFLFIVIAVVLFLLAYLLLKKTSPFLALLENSQDNTKFLQTFGILFIVLGALAILVSFAHNRYSAILYLVFLLVISAVFGLLFSQKMTRNSE